MAKFQIDPAGPPVPRAPPPAPAPLPAEAPAPPPPRPPPPPPQSRGRTVLLVLAATLLLTGGTAVGAMYALDLGPFAYPDRYLLEADEVPDGLRLQALPAPIRQELGIEENPDRVPDEKLDDLDARSGVEPVEAWVESVGTGRLGEQVLIAAARYASQDDAREAVGSAADECGDRDGTGVAMRDGKVVVILLAFTDGAAARLPSVEVALREKADGLAVACRW